jgi:hypothetical protein
VKSKIAPCGSSVWWFFQPSHVLAGNASHSAILSKLENDLKLRVISVDSLVEYYMVMIPKKLSRGDTIGVVSPSRSVTPELTEQFKKGVGFLENFGFNVMVGEHVYSTTLGYAEGDREKN